MLERLIFSTLRCHVPRRQQTSQSFLQTFASVRNRCWIAPLLKLLIVFESETSVIRYIIGR